MKLFNEWNHVLLRYIFLIFSCCTSFFLYGMDDGYSLLIDHLEEAVQSQSQEHFVETLQLFNEQLMQEDFFRQLTIYEELMNEAVQRKRSESILKVLCYNYVTLISSVELDKQQSLLPRIEKDFLVHALQTKNIIILKALATLFSIDQESDSYCQVNQAIAEHIHEMNRSPSTDDQAINVAMSLGEIPEESIQEEVLESLPTEPSSNEDIVRFFDDLITDHIEAVCSKKCKKIVDALNQLMAISQVRLAKKNKSEESGYFAISNNGFTINGFTFYTDNKIQKLFEESYKKIICTNEKAKKRVNFIVKMVPCVITPQNSATVQRLFDSLPAGFAQRCKNHIRYSSKFIRAHKILDYPDRLARDLNVVFDGTNQLFCQDKTGKISVLEIGDKGLYLKSECNGQGWSGKMVALRNNTLASSSGHNIEIWNTKTGKFLRQLKGHRGYIEAILALPQRKLASASTDKTIKIWDTRTGKCLRTIQDDASALEYYPNNILVAASKDVGFRSINFWNIKTGKRLHQYKSKSFYDDSIEKLIFLDDSTLLTQGYSIVCRLNIKTGALKRDNYLSGPYLYVDGLPKFFSCKSSTEFLMDAFCIKVHDFKDKKDSFLSGPAHVIGFGKKINALAHVVDSIIISASDDNTMRIWDSETLQCLNTLKFYAKIEDLFCIDGNTLLFRGSSSKKSSFVALRPFRTFEDVLSQHAQENVNSTGFKNMVTNTKKKSIELGLL